MHFLENKVFKQAQDLQEIAGVATLEAVAIHFLSITPASSDGSCEVVVDGVAQCQPKTKQRAR